MLWFVVQPFKVTCLVIVGLIVSCTLCAPLLGGRRPRTLRWSVVIGILLFVPSCQGIMKVIDASRFGGFAHPDFDSVKNERVARWLPSTATDITTYCRRAGHDARFSVSPDDLTTWFSDYRAKFGWQEPDESFVLGRPILKRDGSEIFDYFFSQHNWECPPEFSEFHCAVAENGAGFTIYYSKSQQVAYLRCGYW